MGKHNSILLRAKKANEGRKHCKEEYVRVNKYTYIYEVNTTFAKLKFHFYISFSFKTIVSYSREYFNNFA